MNKSIDEHGWMDGWMDGLMDGWKDGLMDKTVDENRWMDIFERLLEKKIRTVNRM